MIGLVGRTWDRTEGEVKKERRSPAHSLIVFLRRDGGKES